MNEFMNERRPAPNPAAMFGRLAGAIQTIAEAINTDHPGHPCHGLAGRVEAVLLGMQGPRPIGLSSVIAENAAQFGEPVPAQPLPSAASSAPADTKAEPLTDPDGKSHATAPVQQTTGDDGA